MKDYLRYLLPAGLVIVIGFAGGDFLQGMEPPRRFMACVLALIGLFYVQARINYVNHRLDVEARARAADLLPVTARLDGAIPQWPVHGYLVLAAAAVMVAAGFAFAWQMPWSIAAGGVLWWWGEYIFTRTSTAFLGERLQAEAVVTPNPSHPVVAMQEVPSQVPLPAGAATEAATRSAALMRTIEEKRKEDPLIGAKLGARELNQRLLSAIRNEHGVHTESLLSSLGALAGYACQVSLRSEALSRGESANAPFTVVQDANKRRYFFGDLLNQRLTEGRYSVWNIATSALRKNGLQSLPDLTPIFKHVTESVGSEQFGIPRFPDGHNASDLPLNYVKDLWLVVLPLVREYSTKPAEWPVLFGFALQDALRMSRDVLAPEVALLVIMESAIPMSKVDMQTA